MNLKDMRSAYRFPTAAVTRALGWFSIGVGVAELFMPRGVARTAGLGGRPGLVRSAGVREIITGIGVLTSPRPAPWLWGRVVGDAIDLAAVGTGLAGRSRRTNAGLALGALVAVAALDFVCARAQDEEDGRAIEPARDYGDRSGFPQSVATMRGAARGGFAAPEAANPPLSVGPGPGAVL